MQSGVGEIKTKTNGRAGDPIDCWADVSKGSDVVETRFRQHVYVILRQYDHFECQCHICMHLFIYLFDEPIHT